MVDGLAVGILLVGRELGASEGRPMKWIYVYRVLVIMALLLLGGVQWHNCQALKQLQDQQENLLKPAAAR
jgi:hypothetical protein